MCTLKRRKRMVVSLIGTSLLVGALSWSASRAIRQERLNRQLITAIKQSDYGRSQVAKVSAYLECGADPNAAAGGRTALFYVDLKGAMP